MRRHAWVLLLLAGCPPPEPSPPAPKEEKKTVAPKPDERKKEEPKKPDIELAREAFDLFLRFRMDHENRMAQACIQALLRVTRPDDRCVTDRVRQGRESWETRVHAQAGALWPGLGTTPRVEWQTLNQDGSALFGVKDFFWHGAPVWMVVLARVGDAWRLRDLYRPCRNCLGLGRRRETTGADGSMFGPETRDVPCTKCRPDHTELLDPADLPALIGPGDWDGEWVLPDPAPTLAWDQSTPEACVKTFGYAQDLRGAEFTRADREVRRKALEDLRDHLTPERIRAFESAIDRKEGTARKALRNPLSVGAEIRGDRATAGRFELVKVGDRWFIDRE